jgi:hypothetical protein
MNEVKKGDRYTWGDALEVTVTRVSKAGFWADIEVQGKLTHWRKRQRLPLPETFRKIS